MGPTIGYYFTSLHISVYLYAKFKKLQNIFHIVYSSNYLLLLVYQACINLGLPMYFVSNYSAEQLRI